MTSLNETQLAAIQALRNYKSGSEDSRTTNLRAVATAFVEAREHFYTPSGEPDWQGRTHAYRVWVRETMRLANIQQDELSTVQAAIRYHVGNIMRDRMDPETLASIGLNSSSPKQRSVEKRAKNSEILTIFGNGGSEIVDAAEIVLAAQMVESAYARISLEAIAGMSSKEKKLVHDAMEKVADRVNALVAVAGARRK